MVNTFLPEAFTLQTAKIKDHLQEFPMVLLCPCSQFSWTETLAGVRAALAVQNSQRQPEPLLLQCETGAGTQGPTWCAADLNALSDFTSFRLS